MPVAHPCPQCGKTLHLSETVLGKMICCPGCQGTFRTPAPTAAAPTGEWMAPKPGPVPTPAAASQPDDLPEALPVLEVAPPVLERAPEERDNGPPRRSRRDAEEDWDDRPARRSRADDRDRERDRPSDGRRRPRNELPRRRGWGVGLILGILAIVLVVCGGFGTLVFFAAKAVVDKARVSASIPFANWQPFQPTGGRFLVSVPGSPTPVPMNEPVVNGVTCQKYKLTLSGYDRHFTIVIRDIVPAIVVVSDNNALLSMANPNKDPGTIEPGVQLVNDKPILYQQLWGRELHFQGTQTAVFERAILTRRPDGSATVYYLRIQGSGLRADSSDVKRFFDSLVIFPDPTPIPNPNPNPNPNPDLNRPPQPKPNPNPTPAPEQLKLVGNRLTVHSGGTQMVRTAPDGKSFAALGEDGAVKLVNVPGPEGQQIWTVRATLPGLAGPFNGMGYDPKGTLLAVAAGDHIHLFDASDGKMLGTVPHQTQVPAAFSPAGDLLAIAVRPPDGKANAIHFWNLQQKAPDGAPVPLPPGVTDLVWSDDGTTLVAAVGGEVHLIDPTNRKVKGRPIAAHAAPISGLAISPDGQTLVTVGADKTIKRWSLSDGKLVDIYEGPTNPIGRPAFSSDGSRLATIGGPGDDEPVRLWQTASGRPLYTRVMTGLKVQVSNVDYQRDGSTVLVAVRNEPLLIWDLRGVEAANKMPPYGKPTKPGEAVRFDVPIATRLVRFSPDGKTLAAAGRDGDLLLLNVADGNLLAAKNTNKSGFTFAYGVENRLVTVVRGRTDARLELRNTTSGSVLSAFPAGAGWPRAVAVSPDGKLVAVGFESIPPLKFAQQPPANATAFVRLWDLSAEPKLLGTMEKVPYPLSAVAFGQDGKTLYAAAGHGVRRWRTETREELPDLNGPSSDLSALAVAPDGRVYGGGRDDVLIHVWDAEGKHGLPLEGHTGGVTGLALTTDGKRLASVSLDGTCRLWDTATGKTTAVTEDKSQGGHDAFGLPTFSPDGSLLAVAADYNKVSVLRTSQIKTLPLPPAAVTTQPTTEPAGVAAVKPPQGGFFNAVAFSDNSTLLTADSSGLLRRWDWPGGKLRDESKHDGIFNVASSRDGKVVAVYNRPSVVLRDGVTGKLLAVVRPEQMNKYKIAQIHTFALSPQGDLLALDLRMDQTEELVIWDVKEGRQLAVVQPNGWVSCLEFNPDGKTLAASLFAGECVALFDARDLKETKRVARQKSSLQTVAFSPDGKKLATSSSRGRVVLWDLAEDKELWSGSWTLANSARQPLRFSPDGKWLVAATRGRMVLLDAATGKLRAEVTKTPNESAEPAFSPDGNHLAVVRGTYMPIVVYDMEKLLAAPP